uniref:Putative Outer membrane protein n=1 Tax=mine drainage metagenome TaxID=410659 RepID=E6QQQ3_9ZZZZ
MSIKIIRLILLSFGMLLPKLSVAQTVTLDQAIQMTLNADPSIKEKQELVESARALLDEAKGHRDLMFDANMFEGLAPEVNGGFYQGGAYSGTQPRTDGPFPGGLSDWTSLEFAIIKPLYTFGKIKAYSEAAKGNIEVKEGDVRLRQEEMIKKVKRAYFSYLTARDLRRMLEDVQSHLNDALGSVKKNLDNDNGQSKETDLYALQTAQGMLSKYISQAIAVEKISMDGLKLLTGVGMTGDLSVADDSLTPVDLPHGTLGDFKTTAIADRPEMSQLEAGMRARRALVTASKANRYPNIYAGIIGEANYASNRTQLNNPYLYDPFNNAGLTPVVGIKWDFQSGVMSAKIAQQQAELDALNYKAQFAQAGIPFEVAEAYHHMEADYQSQLDLAKGATAGRRWMIAALADFNAGLEKADKVADALKSYALTQAEYLQTVRAYNLDVAELALVTGAEK